MRQTDCFDKTGKEILEGDICEFTQGKSGCVGGKCEIVFRHGAFRGKQIFDDKRTEYFVPFSDESPAYAPEIHFKIVERNGVKL